MDRLNEAHPIFAFTWNCLHRCFNPLRRNIVGLAQGNVLEIGAGGGENLPFYLQAKSVTLTEPDPWMRRQAIDRASKGWGFGVKVIPTAAEDLPFPSESFDSVVSTLVLCSVENQRKALDEIHRVLKPSGRLYFIEHVRSQNPLLGSLQDLLTPVQKRLCAGCQLNRETLSVLTNAGFKITDLKKPYPFFPLYIGIAVAE